jgi:hypothetical protein
MSALLFLNAASTRIILGFLAGLLIFIFSEIISLGAISILLTKVFNHFVASPSGISFSIALVCFLVFVKTEIDLERLPLIKLPFKNQVIAFLENIIYFKVFSAYSAILGYSIALNIKHEMDKGFYHSGLLETTLMIYLFLIAITSSVALAIKEYSANKNNTGILKLTRHSLILAGLIFLSIFFYYLFW